MDKLEIRARLANFISLLFCLVAISINLFTIITFFVVILTLLEAGHLLFGDVTDSYRLLRKKKFLEFYIASLILFSLSYLLILFIVDLYGKIYFTSIFIAFISDFIANKIRIGNLKKNKK